MKRLLAAVAVAAASALSAVNAPPASAQPCVTAPDVVHVCYDNFGPAGRGAAVIVFPVDYAYVLVGCYYPSGSARYYVGAGTGTTGPVSVTAPVGGVPCV